MMTKILCGDLEESIQKNKKIALRKIFRHFLHPFFFHVYKIIINKLSSDFLDLVQFGINLHLKNSLV